jgi:hypothetical protein
MTRFVFQSQEEDDAAVVTIEFDTEVWLDAFPHFLNLMKASGFPIDPATALYSPHASECLFGDRDFLLFDSDLKQEEHTKEYYDGVGRNS